MQANLSKQISNGEGQPRILLVLGGKDGQSRRWETLAADGGLLWEQARSESEALERLSKREHAVVVLDLRTGQPDAFQIASRIREQQQHSSTPIIFLDTDYRSQACRQSYAFGVADYIAAPLDSETFAARLKLFLQWSQRERGDARRTTPSLTPETDWQSIAQNQSEKEIRKLNRALALRAAELERANRELEKEIGVRARTEVALKETNSELEAFSYSVSHDLRAPLRAMQGFAEALLEDCSAQLTEAGREYASRIVAAANRMDTLVQDLLLYSRVSYNELPLDSVDMSCVMSETLSQLEASLREKSALVSLRQPLPCVIGHHATLVQIVSNLLSNAIKFVAEGTQPRVQIWMVAKEAQARLWVEDNGIGISAEYHSRIFRVFERLHGAETYSGSGIGLAIVRKAVERMGGSVGLESAPGEGSRFWVELPLDTSGKVNGNAVAQETFQMENSQG